MQIQLRKICGFESKSHFIIGSQARKTFKFPFFTLQRPKTGDTLCKECFFDVFEAEIHQTIEQNALFRRGDKVAIAASGGKDSTVLAYTLKLLNERHDYGLDLFLLSIDEGITGSKRLHFSLHLFRYLIP